MSVPSISTRLSRAFGTGRRSSPSRAVTASPWRPVLIRVPLDVALERNRQRRADAIVPEASIRTVASLFEPPTVEEGFSRVRIVEA